LKKDTTATVSRIEGLFIYLFIYLFDEGDLRISLKG
jgi:hypothetical protein